MTKPIASVPPCCSFPICKQLNPHILTVSIWSQDQPREAPCPLSPWISALARARTGSRVGQIVCRKERQHPFFLLSGVESGLCAHRLRQPQCWAPLSATHRHCAASDGHQGPPDPVLAALGHRPQCLHTASFARCQRSLEMPGSFGSMWVITSALHPGGSPQTPQGQPCLQDSTPCCLLKVHCGLFCSHFLTSVLRLGPARPTDPRSL